MLTFPIFKKNVRKRAINEINTFVTPQLMLAEF